MKAISSILISIFIIALLTACTQDRQQGTVVRPPSSDDVPAQETEPLPSENGAVGTGTTQILGDVNKTTAIEIDTVRCDLAKREITFRFKNDDVKRWQLNADVPFPAPSDLAPIHVSINNYEVNGRNPYILAGERQFGPGERFSDNCGGVEVLKPGDDVTCTLRPVPLKTANSFTAGKNEINLNSPTSKHIIQFTC